MSSSSRDCIASRPPSTNTPPCHNNNLCLLAARSKAPSSLPVTPHWYHHSTPSDANNAAAVQGKMGIVMLLHDPVKHRQSSRSDGGSKPLSASPRAPDTAITLEMLHPLSVFPRFRRELVGNNIPTRMATRSQIRFAPQRFSPRAKSANRCAFSRPKAKNRPAMGIHTHWSPV